MSNNNSQALAPCTQLQHWLFYTPMGREILRKERIFLGQNIAQIFGNYSLQLGLSEINLLQGNKITNHYTLNRDLKAELHCLPFASNSINLIICPHRIEFTPNYPAALAELQRILAPNGYLIISCFNRYSWFGLFKRWMPVLKTAQLISLETLKQQLQGLNFCIEGGKFFSYCPPFTRAAQLAKYRWLNQVGDRWLPTLANSFTLIARKDLVTPTLISPSTARSYELFNPSLGTLCNKN